MHNNGDIKTAIYIRHLFDHSWVKEHYDLTLAVCLKDLPRDGDIYIYDEELPHISSFYYILHQLGFGGEISNKRNLSSKTF